MANRKALLSVFRAGEVSGVGNEIRLLAGFLIGIHKRSVSGRWENRFISYGGRAVLRKSVMENCPSDLQ